MCEREHGERESGTLMGGISESGGQRTGSKSEIVCCALCVLDMLMTCFLYSVKLPSHFLVSFPPPLPTIFPFCSFYYLFSSLFVPLFLLLCQQ